MNEAPQSKRSLLASKWSKIRRSSGDSDEKQSPFTTNVSDFLNGPPPTQSAKSRPSPRIDISVARRWPGATELQQLVSEEHDASVQQSIIRPVKKTRRRGLTVQFSPAAPVVIGHGGDDTVDPTIYISQAKTRLLGSQCGQYLGDGLHNPGTRARAYSSPDSNRAHASLVSAGVFGDRPPSRKSRPVASVEGPDLLADLRKEYTPPDTLTPPASEDEPAYFSNRSPIPKRKPVHVGRPAALKDTANDNELSDSDSLRSLSRPVLRVDGPEISSNPRLMHEEEGRAFFRAVRHSKELFMGTAGIRPGSSASSESRCLDSSTNAVQISPPITPPLDDDLARLQVKDPQDGRNLGRLSSRDNSSLSLPGLLTGEGAATSPDTSEHKSSESGEISIHSSGPLSLKAFSDFADRVNQMRGVFRLTAEKERSGPTSSDHWMRCAFWWLRKAKIGLDVLLNTNPQGLLMQAHVDMAKAWWILEEGAAQHISSEDLSSHEDAAKLRSHLEATALWMDKHSIMPPEASLIQGQDTTIWITYPTFASDIERSLVSAATLTSVQEHMPLEDTKQHFLYQKMFAMASVGSDASSTGSIPCSLSIVRHRTHYRASMLVSSQNALVNVLVSPATAAGTTNPTWHDVKWRSKSFSMGIRLQDGHILNIALTEHNYRSLSTVFEFTRSISKSFEPAQGEKLVYSSPLRAAQYWQSGTKQVFPNHAVKNAFIGLFEVLNTEIHANWKRKIHRGYRLVLVTPTTSRTLGAVSHSFDATSPFLFELVDLASTGAGLVLRSSDGKDPWKMLLTFGSPRVMNEMLDLILGSFKHSDEYTKATVAVRSFSAQAIGGVSTEQRPESFSQIRWCEASIIDRRTTRSDTALSESLRIVLSHSAGLMIDRLNLPPGMLLMRLPVSHDPSVTLARQAQLDLTSAIDRHAIATTSLSPLVAATSSLSELATLRTYAFQSLPDLHTFQEALTGYTVACDLVPSRFAITRHRTVVSLHKKVESTSVRLQVLARGEGDTQIAVFFEDFPLADAMIFPIKASDVFERVKGSSVRLAEAKFSLQGKGDEHQDGGVDAESGLPSAVRRRFVNTEGLQYREEADDILVTFASDADADAFCATLPGEVQAGSRSFLKRR